jgi:hypothetical protein
MNTRDWVLKKHLKGGHFVLLDYRDCCGWATVGYIVTCSRVEADWVNGMKEKVDAR